MDESHMITCPIGDKFDQPMGFSLALAVIGYLILVNQTATAGFYKPSLHSLTNLKQLFCHMITGHVIYISVK